MTKIVDVRFNGTGKSYRFDANELEIKRGDHLVVDNQKGKAYAVALNDAHDLLVEPKKPLRKVVRFANEEDEARHAENLEQEKKAYKFCKEKIAELELDMKLVSVEQAFTGKKMMFYFTADDRVDFRELVKELAAEFHTRIEMRQIGVRDETTMCGGIGVCGRELCCCTYLTEFAPVSIKMAKAQNLSLNPGKISGTCGRLMCCLRNEAEAYEELNKTVPKMNEKVKTPEGDEGTVTSLDVLRQRVKVLIEDGDDKELRDYAASELTFKPRGQKNAQNKNDQGKNGQKNAQNKDDREKDNADNAQGAADESAENKEKPKNQKRHRSNKRGRRGRGGNRENGQDNGQGNNHENGHGGNRENSQGNSQGNSQENSRENGSDNRTDAGEARSENREAGTNEQNGGEA